MNMIDKPISTLQEYMSQCKVSQDPSSHYNKRFLVKQIPKFIDQVNEPTEAIESLKITKNDSFITNEFDLEHHVTKLVDYLRFQHVNVDLISDVKIVETKSVVPVRVIDKVVEQETLGKIQFAEFPGFEKLVLPLGINPSKYLVQSLRVLALPDKWQSLYKSARVKQFFVTVFWYVWHCFWKQNGDMERLNDMLCVQFVQLFLNYVKSDKDLVFQVHGVNKHLPNVISHSCLLVCDDAFPFSDLDQETKSNIIARVFECLTGLVPTKQPTIEKQQPLVSKPVSFMSQKSLLAHVLSKKNTEALIDLDTMNTRQTISQRKRVQESATVGVICKSKKSDFNVFQNSPLINRYLNSFGNGREYRNVAIKRNNVLDPIVDGNAVTYRQLIQQSLKQSKLRSLDFDKAQEELVKERIKIQSDIQIVLASESEKAKRILKKQGLVKQTAEMIIEQSSKKGTKLG